MTVQRSMFSSVAKSALSGAVLLSTITTAQAANSDEQATTIPIDMSGMTTTKHEIAVMQVLSEICPPMLRSSQRQRFYRTYTTQLQALMPSVDNPKAAVQYLSTQQDYRHILRGIRSWTMSFPKADNKALCEDLANN